jgi:hypothetical protein
MKNAEKIKLTETENTFLGFGDQEDGLFRGDK